LTHEDADNKTDRATSKAACGVMARELRKVRIREIDFGMIATSGKLVSSRRG
jgi:hypothetical protein